MHYLRVIWLHDDPDEPVELFSELNDDRWEVRKVERFRNGFVGFADASSFVGDTRLGLEPMPPLDEIDCHPEFQAEEIGPEAFEVAWIQALAVVGSTTSA